jgi:hypothetical protein
LRVLQVDGELDVLRILTDRREALTRRRVQTADPKDPNDVTTQGDRLTTEGSR